MHCRHHNGKPFAWLVALCLLGPSSQPSPAAGLPWVDAVLAKLPTEELHTEFQIESNWLRQDTGGDPTKIDASLIEKILTSLPDHGDALRSDLAHLVEQDTQPGDRAWLTLYAHAAELRRNHRFGTVLATAPRILFIKRRTIRPSFFGYTEGQSDAQAESHFLPGSSLCLLEFDGTRPKLTTLLEDKGGVFRDPAVSWDGKRIVFAWKRSQRDDDYHLYELTLPDTTPRQLTTGEGVADYEAAFLPDGDLVFSSSRCVQTVDCYWTEVSNLYTCKPDGSHIRRLGFDQVHTLYPQVMDDGRVIYTRWDYNDRGQVYPQPLFQMNPDGTGQAEFYGNNSWFPTTIAHARGIPGTTKALAILCGHHSTQAGKLAIIDPSRGRQENQGVQLVSPFRETKAERVDAYGQKGELFRYPYPLNEAEWLVSYAPDGWEGANRRKDPANFAIYWMDINGHRELLVSDPDLPCQQPVPLVPRTPPPSRASTVKLDRDIGTYYLQDVYQGPGLAGIRRGTVKKLRVVALEFRPAGIGMNHSGGPGGGALISTPVSIGNGTWDVKRVLGETPVHEDGSAFFIVPARTPLYFQAIDTKGRSVQTMRSWSTLQPGENASCVGCHEDKDEVPANPAYAATLALQAPPKPLDPFHGPARGFSFPKEIQPILDRHCTRCHDDRQPVLDLAAGKTPPPLEKPTAAGDSTRSFSLLGETVTDTRAKRHWSDSYLMLTQARRDGNKGDGPFRGQPDGRLVKWISSQSVPTPLPPYSAGAAKSEFLALLEAGHHEVTLSRAELEKIACWIDLVVPYCGDYREAHAWNEKEIKKFDRYSAKREQMDALDQEAVEALIQQR